MDWLPNLTASHFALAGAVCALGPVLIHLFNRRRYKTVAWAAMDFLREAVERNKRIVELRDILLMLLRAAAVALFGLALARPFFSGKQIDLERGQPVHAVVLIDNSLSMGYAALDGTLLDRAKTRAKELLTQLPSGSRYSIVPAAGASYSYQVEPYADKAAAREAIDRIEIVDRPASLSRVVELARKACETGSNLRQRVLFLGDQQELNWRAANPEMFQGLPEFQAVRVSSGDIENTWISDLRLEDGIADSQSPTRVVVGVRHRGPGVRDAVQVTLKIDGVEVDSRVVSVEPGEVVREVEFVHTFSESAPAPGKTAYVPIEASLAPDRLAADDVRSIVAPVVSAAVIVCVDQYGEDEQPAANRLGETHNIRKFLAPKSQADAGPQLVTFRRLRPDQVTQETLRDARLCIVAGVNLASDTAELLREYVIQGGRLAIAAGGDFDPERWNAVAWNDGDGVLPLPLAREPIGQLPESTQGDLTPRFLRFVSLEQSDPFRIAGNDEDRLRDLYGEPYFFRIIGVDRSPETIAKLAESLKTRSIERRDKQGQTLEAIDLLARRESQGVLSDAERKDLETLRSKLESDSPRWLAWAERSSADARPANVAKSDPTALEQALTREVESLKPQTLAEFDDAEKNPFLVERRLGRGRTAFIATSVSTTWNTMPATHAFVAIGRLLQGMVAETFPERTFEARDEWSMPLPTNDQAVNVGMLRPGRGAPEPLDLGFVGADLRGLTMRGLVERGVYRLAATSLAEPDPNQPVARVDADEASVWKMAFAVAGDPRESELDATPRAKIDSLTDTGVVRWVDDGQSVAIDSGASTGPTWWWWLALAVLALLVVELCIVGASAAPRPQVAA